MNIDWSKCPEATHFDPVDQNFLREIGESLLLFNTMRGWTVPIHTQYGVTIKDCNRPLIKRPEWTGEGLPPVGTVCEWAGCTFAPEDPKEPDLHIGDHVTIIAHFKDGEFDLAAFTFNPQTHNPDRGTAWVNQGAHGCFRPIRTPEQIAAEERKKAHEELMHHIAGYMGRDNPHSADDGLAKYLLDHDYRKQSAP